MSPTARSVIMHAILAVGALGLAYLVWTDERPSADVDEVTVFECSPDDLSEIHLSLADKDVTIELGHGDDEPTWVVLERHPENGEASRERFLASDGITGMLEGIAPLRARRSLGTLDEEQIAEVELDEPEGTLRLACGDRNVELALGGRAYGSGDRYARQGNTVFLLGNERLQPLENPELRLMMRELHTFEWSEVAAAEVDAFDRHKRLLHRNRLDEASAQWVDAERPDTVNELYGNWLATYPRLRVQSYLEGEPGSDLEGESTPPPVSVMRLRFEGEDGDELGRLELSRVDTSPPAYYARTETTRGWVRVPPSVAQELEDDARPVLGLDPIDRTPPPTATDAGTEDAGAPDAGTAAPGATETPTESPTEPPNGAPTPTEPAPAGADPHGAHAPNPHGALPPGHP
ncbi:MAG: DUF4340 domain-containing protein [Sandaracinaceae bacterium]